MKGKVWQELKNMSVVELEAKQKDLEDKIFPLKFKHSSTPLKNPLEIRGIRRMLARIKTLFKEKSLENSKETTKK